MKKRFVCSCCALFLIVLLILISKPGLAAAETFVLKAVTAWPKTAVENKMVTTFTDIVDQMVAKKYPGELKIQYLGGPEVVKPADQAETLQRGVIDMLFTAGAYYTNVLPEIDALKLTDYTPSEERANGAWAFLNDLHEKKLGVHYLARLGLNVQFHLFLKKPIKTADLKGLNIRVSPLYLQAIKGLGGNPIAMPPSDVYTALERNVVDGYCWPIVGLREYGLQKLTKYIVEPGFYRVPNPLLVNLKTWNKLPQKLKNLLDEASVEAEKKVVAEFAELAKQELPILNKEGVQTLDLPPAEKEKFLKIAYDEGWKDIIQKNPQTGPELKKLLTKGK
ncbi:MAG TPA: TRAP transporter substrate-binding protein DctP [Syntrophorhabdales bacterium]|nr:TRAP transporter substrate-binding protein DctP [Syntrophorhabdales bacterium]